MKNKFREVEKIIKALANAKRLQIVKYLNLKRSATVGELAEELKISTPAVSKHLSLLSAAGILDYERHGEEVHYYPDQEVRPVVREVLSMLG